MIILLDYLIDTSGNLNEAKIHAGESLHVPEIIRSCKHITPMTIHNPQLKSLKKASVIDLTLKYC